MEEAGKGKGVAKKGDKKSEPKLTAKQQAAMERLRKVMDDDDSEGEDEEELESEGESGQFKCSSFVSLGKHSQTSENFQILSRLL